MKLELLENVNVGQLDAIADTVESVIKLSSKIGDIGYAPDFSNNTLRNRMETENPLLTWLLNTPMSTQLRQSTASGLAPIHQDSKTGEFVLMFPYQVGTLPPDDTSGACCWVPMEITKAGGQVPLRLLCLKDNRSIMEKFINRNRKAGSNDLINYFLKAGESVTDARKRMAKMSMAFYTARNVILGTTTGGTPLLKPFHGLLQVLENPDVIKVFGGNVLGAFDKMGDRQAVLGGDSYTIWVHPITKRGLEQVVVEGKNGKLPTGWTRNGDSLAFNNNPVQADKIVPVDITRGTGEAWWLHGESTGAYLATDLSPADAYIVSDDFTSTNDPKQGCAGENDWYYNLGASFNNNPNHLGIITDIPLPASSLGNTLFGLDRLIQPDTLVPFV